LAELPTLNQVNQQIELLNKNNDAADIDALQKIKNELAQIAEIKKQNNQLQTLLKQAPQTRMALNEKRQESALSDPEVLPESASVSYLEQRLATEIARNQEWSEQINELEEEQQAMLESQETLPTEIAEQEQKIALVTKDNAIIEMQSDALIDKWTIATRNALLENQLEALTLQQRTLSLRRELAKINQQILENELSISSKKIELLQIKLIETSTKSSLEVIEQAQQLTRTLGDVPPYIKQWNIKNEQLAAEFEALNRQLIASQRERKQLQEQRQRVTQNLSQIKGNIKWLKNSPEFSDAIGAQLRSLPDLSDKTDLANTITAAHLQLFKLSTALASLKDIPLLIANVAETENLSTLDQKVLASILKFRFEVLNDAIDKTDQFIAEITRLDALQDQFYQEIQDERDFLREKRLFIRDRTSIWSLFSLDLNVWLGTTDLIGRVSTLIQRASLYPGELTLLGLLFGFIGLIIIQFRKMGQKYRLASAKYVGRVRKDTFLSSFILFISAISNGILIAVCLLVVEYWIESRLSSFYSYDLSKIFISFSTLICVWESVARMALPGGLLETHLGYSKVFIEWLKSSLSKNRWMLYSLLISILVSEMLAETSDSLLLRILFTVLIIWLIAFTIILLKRSHLPIILPKLLQSPAALQLLRIALVLPLIIISILAIWRYFYTSWVVLFYYYAILLCLLLTALFQQLGVRWLEIEQRRISLQRALEKREELLQREHDDLSVEDIDESVIPIESIGQQSLTLLNIAVLIVLFIMLSALFSGGLLAFHWMDDVTIWDVLTVTESGNIVEAISLKSLLTALISVGLSFFLAKNLPGLLELLILHRLNISTGATYATNTLLRYAIVLAGFLIAVSALGFHWSRLQWLVAALGVGLGFGLQEIFANLVSGIILLFERPVRVGDTITIQDLTGQVTRINTRATTILDWDQKEIIVPNKSLITEQLINWSLSDSTTRVILPIGVAYGSNVELVKKLLIQSASECDEVCKTPPPSALFLLFGASSLDFELRIYMPKIEGRALIKDKLNSRIDQLFREHNIEIPFPQMDIHVRDLPTKI